MIDEKINNTLKELELGLKNIESARKQVEKTVTSYDDLSEATTEYVKSLGSLTTKVQELINLIGKDYIFRTKTFEQNCDKVIQTIDSASEKISGASEGFKLSLMNVENKLKYSLFFNIVTLVIVVFLLFYSEIK